LYRSIVLDKHAPPEYAVRRERDYLDFFERIEQLLFTSHVVGELKGRGRLPSAMNREFWLCSMDYLKRKRASEQLVELISMGNNTYTRENVCIVGPVDASLLYLAIAEQCLLMTDDSRLLSRYDGEGKLKIELVENLL
jgi:predicted nucleic acid-binding protein